MYFVCNHENDVFYVHQMRDTCINIFETFEFVFLKSHKGFNF